ncbi:MAG: M3 family metallopeptidase [Acinetobacter sp.]
MVGTFPQGQQLAKATLPVLDFSQLTPLKLAEKTLQALDQTQLVLKQFSNENQSDHAEAHFRRLKELEYAENQLQQVWGVFYNLNNIVGNDELRQQHKIVLAKLTAFFTEYGQHQGLYQSHLILQQSALFHELAPADRRAFELAIQKFQLMGVGLQDHQKKRFAEINARLSELSSQFSDHVLDAAQAWSLPLANQQLSGIPETILKLLQQMAQQRTQEGGHHVAYLATLDTPVYNALMTYADDRNLREVLHKAFYSIASEAYDFPEFDNSNIMVEIVQLRHEKAQLLGFKNFAELSLATKMAQSVDTVKSFLNDLAEKARSSAQYELKELQQEGLHYGIHQIEPWDVAYLSEKIKQRRFKLAQEDLKPYFPIQTVVSGLFKIAEKIFGIQIEQKQASVWHKDVNYYEISDHGKVIAGFYFDLYARPNKKGGAWESGLRSRVKIENDVQLPISLMVANFTPPVEDQPVLLTHNEIIVLFHEFGHGLHDMLTQVENLNVSGTQGVEWDAIELPSQFMEFWAWDPSALAWFSQHIETKQPLAETLLTALLNSRHFQSGLQTLRQLEFALFDIELYSLQKAPDIHQIQQIMDQVRQKVTLISASKYNRFQHSFNHIFSGGYAAGYYSYKWAKVLASDAYALFEEYGGLNEDIGHHFKNQILAVGASVDALSAFKEFRGREPQIDALIRHNGWS